MRDEKQIEKQEFINTFQESLGIEGAENLIRETTDALFLNDKAFYSKEEAIQMCEEITKKTGFVSIIARLLLARLILR